MNSNLQRYTMYIYDGVNGAGPWIIGQVYYFHEDSAVDDSFKMVVDENDFPVKVFVRY